TTKDDTNYDLARLVSYVEERFSVASDFPVFAYTGADEPTDADRRGSVYITGAGVGEQLYDNQSGLRLWGVTSKATRTCNG
ncbi:MAG: hypothetical protein KDD43_07080, partial [Bdellovibrionales bacterium]|nr:hypothetical protein [Bdellovibrionales bacterium]